MFKLVFAFFVSLAAYAQEPLDLGVLGIEGDYKRFGQSYERGQEEMLKYLRSMGAERGQSIKSQIQREQNSDYGNVKAEENILRRIRETEV